MKRHGHRSLSSPIEHRYWLQIVRGICPKQFSSSVRNEDGSKFEPYGTRDVNKCIDHPILAVLFFDRYPNIRICPDHRPHFGRFCTIKKEKLYTSSLPTMSGLWKSPLAKNLQEGSSEPTLTCINHYYVVNQPTNMGFSQISKLVLMSNNCWIHCTCFIEVADYLPFLFRPTQS